jgi:hypothetical protein
MSIESLQEEKRYLLSELSLEKEQHQAALDQLTTLQRTHNALLEQFAETEAQLQETQVALLNKDKRVHALQRQSASAADVNVVESLTKENVKKKKKKKKTTFTNRFFYRRVYVLKLRHQWLK